MTKTPVRAVYSTTYSQHATQICTLTGNKFRELATVSLPWQQKFAPTGQTVNHVYYMKVLKRLREKLDGNDPNFLPTTHGSCITTMHLLTRHRQ
jgi:hypothetical protein